MDRAKTFEQAKMGQPTVIPGAGTRGRPSAGSSAGVVGTPMHFAPVRITRETVKFSVRGPMIVDSEEDLPAPGCSVVDLIFPTPSKVREVVFRNYYTAWVTVIVRIPLNADDASTRTISPEVPEDIAGSWVLSIPHRTLMTCPHLETGSQDCTSITNYESLVEWDNLVAMRLVLRQPSSAWKTFHVEELNVYGDSPRFTQLPIPCSTTFGLPRHIEQDDNLLAMVIKQTIDSLNNKKYSGTDKGSSNESEQVLSYEFATLHQL